MAKKLQSGTFIVFDKETNEPIGIRWVFDSEDENGNQLKDYHSKEELGEELFLNLCAGIREDQAADAKEKYHCPVSTDSLEYEGDIFADNHTPAYYINIKEEKENHDSFLNLLTDKQRAILEEKMGNPTISNRELAIKFKVSH